MFDKPRLPKSNCHFKIGRATPFPKIENCFSMSRNIPPCRHIGACGDPLFSCHRSVFYQHCRKKSIPVGLLEHRSILPNPPLDSVAKSIKYQWSSMTPILRAVSAASTIDQLVFVRVFLLKSTHFSLILPLYRACTSTAYKSLLSTIRIVAQKSTKIKC